MLSDAVSRSFGLTDVLRGQRGARRRRRTAHFGASALFSSSPVLLMAAAGMGERRAPLAKEKEKEKERVKEVRQQAPPRRRLSWNSLRTWRP